MNLSVANSFCIFGLIFALILCGHRIREIGTEASQSTSVCVTHDYQNDIIKESFKLNRLDIRDNRKVITKQIEVIRDIDDVLQQHQDVLDLILDTSRRD